MSFFKFLLCLPFIDVRKFLREDRIVMVPVRDVPRFAGFLREQEIEFSWEADGEAAVFVMQFHAWKELLIKDELNRMAYGY